jgi:serine/threonine-protein kinase RsbW
MRREGGKPGQSDRREVVWQTGIRYQAGAVTASEDVGMLSEFGNRSDAALVRLTIPAKPEYLVLGRLVLTGLSRAALIEPETLGDLKLALTEACTNSIEHGYRDGEEGSVSIRIELGSGHVAIEVVDEGAGFDPALLADLPVEPAEDGKGIAIIQAIVDELEIGAGGGGQGTRLAFSKRLD